MVKTTRRQFELFKKTFKTWQKHLGLLGWDVYFRHDVLQNSYAECYTNLNGRCATITLNSVIDTFDDVKMLSDDEVISAARHEAIELLMAPLNNNAKYRYATESDLEECNHAVIRTLENILPLVPKNK